MQISNAEKIKWQKGIIQFYEHPFSKIFIVLIFFRAAIVVKEGDAIIKLVNTNAQLNTENAALSADYCAINNNAEKVNKLEIATRR